MKKVPPFLPFAFCLLPFAFFVCGCGKVPATHFYTLDAPQVAAAGKPFPYNVAVARFHAAQRLAQDRLVYMAAPYHVDYYNYHRWTGMPADLVTSVLITSLKRAAVFRSVSEVRSGGQPDFVLRGEIQNLEEVDSETSVTARVSLTLDATDVKTRAIVWSGAASAESPVSKGDVDAVARALNEGVNQCIQKLVANLSSSFPERAGL